MKFIKELIHRRIPHIIGSYLIAGTSLILFLDWLVNRYTLPEYYTTIALFSIIAILPTVIILSYFHGAPGKDEWNKVEKLGIPVNILFIAFTIAFYIFYNKSEDDSPIKNVYFDVTSSANYIDYYYEDWGFGSHNYYPKEKYTILSIDDKLLNSLRDNIFRALTVNFAGEGINIDVSFPLKEQYHVNQFIFLKNNNVKEEDLLLQKLHIDSLKILLLKRLEYYSSTSNIDILLRAFIYKGFDNLIGQDSVFYIIDFGTWKRAYNGKNKSSSWAPFTDSKINLVESSSDLEQDITSAITDYFTANIKGAVYAGASRVGEIIKVLDDNIAMIKIFNPGSLKKKMRLSSRRVYNWTEGGAELRIYDYKFIMSCIEVGGEDILKRLWALYMPKEEFDLQKANTILNENKTFINEEIEKIHNNLRNNIYNEGTTTISDDMSYYLEVIDVSDSTATVKLFDTKMPCTYIKVGDLVEIMK